MKKNIYILILFSTQLFTLNLFGQTLYTKTDSISLKSNSIIQLIIPTHRGNVQWEKSLDNKNWFELKGEKADSLKINSGNEALFRAKITEGNCNPIYSDSALVSTQDTITKNILDLSKNDLALISDSNDISSGDYLYTGIDTTDNFEVGKIIVDEQSGGTIRKISDLSQSGDTVSLKTEPATMEDLFQNTSFKLSTDMIYPTQNLKSASLIEIEKALTDKDGYIHPVEIKYESPEGMPLKSVSVFENEKTNGGSLYMHKDWSGTKFYDMTGTFKLPNKQGIMASYSGNVKSYISEGYFTFDPVFKFEFKFDRPKITWENFEISKGEITKFKFYSDRSQIDFKNILAFESDIAYEFGKEWTLVPNIINSKFKFLVGGVPLWIDFIIDVKCSLSAEFASGTITSQGFRNNNFITIGKGYENKSWYTIKEIEKENESYESNSGFTNSVVRFEIFPSVEMKFYSIVGPYFKVGPYLSYEYTKSSEDNWDKKIDLGVDANIGVSVDVFGREIASANAVNWNFFEVNLWKAPGSIKLISGNNQSAEINNLLPNPIIVKVYNSLGLPVNDVHVHFSPASGNVSQTTVQSDANGLAQTQWTLSSSIGEQSLKIYLLDGKDQEINGCSITVIASATLSGNAPVADFTSAKTNPTKGETIQFTDKSTNAPTSWLWSFGDGTTSNLPSPSHTYSTAGIYSISLMVTNSFGNNTKSLTNFITVSETGTGGTSTLTYDSKTYKTVIINGKEWMAENLAYLPSVNSGGSLTRPDYYVFGYNGHDVNEAKATDNYKTYGVLYNWYAAKAACPPGWHLPSDEEWTALSYYLGGDSLAGGKLKESGNVHWKDPNKGATDELGFCALPGGSYGPTGFFSLNFQGYWWSSTPTTRVVEFTSGMVYMQSGTSWLHRSSYYWNAGYSVRCVKD